MCNVIEINYNTIVDSVYISMIHHLQGAYKSGVKISCEVLQLNDFHVSDTV